MAHYAILDENNIVENVICVCNEDICDEHGNECEELGAHVCKSVYCDESIRAVQTSYHANFRKKFASIGDRYLEEHDVFISPQPYPSSTLNTETFDWECPVPKPENPPENKIYVWSEEDLNWILMDTRLPQVKITNELFRSNLTLEEKILWDNPETGTELQKVIITTAKLDLPTTLYRDKNNEILDLLVSRGIFTEERMNEFIDKFLNPPAIKPDIDIPESI